MHKKGDECCNFIGFNLSILVILKLDEAIVTIKLN